MFQADTNMLTVCSSPTVSYNHSRRIPPLNLKIITSASLGHVIVTEDFKSGIDEAKSQQSAWTKYISEYSRIKAFSQLTMSPTIEWGVRNLILSAGLGGMRPNIAMLGFYNMDEWRKLHPQSGLYSVPPSLSRPQTSQDVGGKVRNRRRGDTSARLLEFSLPTDGIRTEAMMGPKSYMAILEDLALRHRLNVAVGKGFESLETPRRDGSNTKKFIDLWPIQMSAEITDGGKSVLTSNFDTCRFWQSIILADIANTHK